MAVQAQRVGAPPAEDRVWCGVRRAAEPSLRAPLPPKLGLTAALSQPQRERPNGYGGSGHGHRSVIGTRGGAASDLRLFLMRRALMQCFPRNSTDSVTRSQKCVVEALSWPQRARLDRYNSSGHSESQVLGA